MEICRFAFLRPPLGDLGATYDDHLRLIGKRIVDFLLALIELKLSFVWCKNLDRSFFRFVTMHACDGRTGGQTDEQTELSSLDRVCIPCSAVKTVKN